MSTLCRRSFYSGLLMLALIAFSLADPGSLLKLAESRYSSRSVETVQQWLGLIDGFDKTPETEKLLTVNDFFNRRIRFANDSEIWQRKDYWATPLETMGRLQGDCEDFSIAKYISLLKMDVPVDKLRLTYVKATLGNGRQQAHMVLAYYPTPTAEPLILDNISKEILPASRRRDLKPVFSFNSAGLWVAGQQTPRIKQPETRLSRWRDVLQRMQAEGM